MRILYFQPGSTIASRVYGCGGSSFTSNVAGTSTTFLKLPQGIALGNDGGLFVADYANSRVVFFPNGSTVASKVWGQSGSFTTSSQNIGTVTANTLNLPLTIAVDSLSGGLFVADTFNHRVLFYPNNSYTAMRVYGQMGSFISSAVNNGGSVSANSIWNPQGLVFDAVSGGIYLSDNPNNRILFFAANSTTASKVYGQPIP